MTGPGSQPRNSTGGPLPFWSFQSKEKMSREPEHKHGHTRGSPGAPRASGGRERHTCQATDHPHCLIAFSDAHFISERPTSSWVPKLTSNNPVVGGRGLEMHALAAHPQVGSGAPAHAPWLFSYSQSPRKPAWFATVVGHVEGISPGTPGRAPSSPLSPLKPSHWKPLQDVPQCRCHLAHMETPPVLH